MADVMTAQFSEQTEIKRLSLVPELEFAWYKFFSSGQTRQRFLVYLVEVYHYVKYTCPLMELARDRAENRFPAYHDYLVTHIQEETGHENWVIRDLARLGLDPDKVKHSKPFRPTQNMIGSQLYVLQSEQPEAYLGYIYTMEGNTANTNRLDEICTTLDISPRHLSAMYLHAKVDIEHHIVDLKNWLDQHLQDCVLQQAVLDNMERSAANAADMVLNIAYLDEDDIDHRLTQLAFAPKRKCTPHCASD